MVIYFHFDTSGMYCVTNSSDLYVYFAFEKCVFILIVPRQGPGCLLKFLSRLYLLVAYVLLRFIFFVNESTGVSLENF